MIAEVRVRQQGFDGLRQDLPGFPRSPSSDHGRARSTTGQSKSRRDVTRTRPLCLGDAGLWPAVLPRSSDEPPPHKGNRGQGRADSCAATVIGVSLFDPSVTSGSDHEMNRLRKALSLTAVLSMLAMPTAALTSAASAATSGQVVVAANQPWTDTGVDVSGSVMLTASGTIDVGGPEGNLPPAGSSDCTTSASTYSGQWAALGFPCWSLIARVNDNPPFAVGNGGTFSVPSGRLFLGVDDETGSSVDNSGSWSVAVNGAAPVPAPVPAPQQPMIASHVECSGHLHAPWVALYKDINFGGQCDAYEGPGNVVLPSGVADTASSINIGANGRFLGKGGASLPIQYGLEIADLRTISWNDRVEEVQIDGTPGDGVVKGKACLFNAPTGVSAPGEFVGHMAWAFRIGSTDTWEFGATEGNGNIAILPGDDNHSWSDMGSWDYVKSTFQSGVHYDKGKPYYTRYMCKDEPDSLLPAASAEISNQWINGFFAPFNDCLTKSVKILQAYGASLPDAIDPLPNAYFDNLKDLGFTRGDL